MHEQILTGATLSGQGSHSRVVNSILLLLLKFCLFFRIAVWKQPTRSPTACYHIALNKKKILLEHLTIPNRWRLLMHLACCCMLRNYPLWFRSCVRNAGIEQLTIGQSLVQIPFSIRNWRVRDCTVCRCLFDAQIPFFARSEFGMGDELNLRLISTQIHRGTLCTTVPAFLCKTQNLWWRLCSTDYYSTGQVFGSNEHQDKYGHTNIIANTRHVYTIVVKNVHRKRRYAWKDNCPAYISTIRLVHTRTHITQTSLHRL